MYTFRCITDQITFTVLINMSFCHFRTVKKGCLKISIFCGMFLFSLIYLFSVEAELVRGALSWPRVELHPMT